MKPTVKRIFINLHLVGETGNFLGAYGLEWEVGEPPSKDRLYEEVMDKIATMHADLIDPEAKKTA